MTDTERLALLEAVLLSCKIFLPWAVDSMKHAVDEVNGGNYSPELLHGMSLREAVEAL